MISKNLIVKNLKVNYYQSDNFNRENALVFLSGWGSETMHFTNILSQCDNFVALDLPGFGKSEIASKIWSVKEYACFLKDFLDKLEVNKPVLVGHSFGASVIIKFCATYNGAKKIILIASAGVRRRGLKIFLYRIVAKTFKIIFSLPLLNLFKEKVRRNFYKIIGAEDYLNAGRLKENFKKIISQDLQEDMKKINTETVLIWGENDIMAPLKDGQLINRLIKNSKLFVIKNAGHFVFIDQPEEFNKIFFDEIKY